MTRHDRFEWDPAKAAANMRKHAVTFPEAMRVLGDKYFAWFHVEAFDAAHSDQEDRYVTTASDPYSRDIVLVITWTNRHGATRIISARPATRAERNEYEAEIQRRWNRPQDPG